MTGQELHRIFAELAEDAWSRWQGDDVNPEERAIHLVFERLAERTAALGSEEVVEEVEHYRPQGLGGDALPLPGRPSGLTDEASPAPYRIIPGRGPHVVSVGPPPAPRLKSLRAPDEDSPTPWATIQYPPVDYPTLGWVDGSETTVELPSVAEYQRLLPLIGMPVVMTRQEGDDRWRIMPA